MEKTQLKEGDKVEILIGEHKGELGTYISKAGDFHKILTLAGIKFFAPGYFKAT